MEYGIIVLMIIGGILLYIKINELQKQVKLVLCQDLVQVKMRFSSS